MSVYDNRKAGSDLGVVKAGFACTMTDNTVSTNFIFQTLFFLEDNRALVRAPT